MDGTLVETAYSASSNDMYGKKNRTLWHASVDLREQLDLKVYNNDLISYLFIWYSVFFCVIPNDEIKQKHAYLWQEKTGLSFGMPVLTSLSNLTCKNADHISFIFINLSS